MANEILKDMGARKVVTPQRTAARADQVKNSAGGFVFKVSDEQRLLRFLILGTSTGTYYASAQAHTKENVDAIRRIIDKLGVDAVKLIVDVSVAGRAPKQQPTLFALAIASASKDETVRRAALEAVPSVCRTGTMLYEFVQFVENERRWSKMLRNSVSKWYTEKEASQLAYQAIKYRQREGWTHRDVLRLSHPKTSDAAKVRVFDFMCGREVSTDVDDAITGYLKAQTATSTSELVSVITQFNLPWEAIPSESLNKAEVWEALIPSMGLGALIRQLSRFTRLGIIAPLSATNLDIAKKITDPIALRKARVHPMGILDALLTYQSGRSTKGSSSWTPVNDIVDALDTAFYASFGTIEPAHKRTLLALDVSGSMSAPINDHLSARVGSAAMALVTAATEPSTHIVGFTGGGWGYGMRSRSQPANVDNLTVLDITPRMRLDTVVKNISGLPFGGTDCSLPMQYAQAKGLQVDHFVVLTDSETYAGVMHPFEALCRYRDASGLPSRLSVVGMTSTGFSIADPTDAGMMDCVGFDLNTPNLLSSFARGDF